MLYPRYRIRLEMKHFHLPLVPLCECHFPPTVCVETSRPLRVQLSWAGRVEAQCWGGTRVIKIPTAAGLTVTHRRPQPPYCGRGALEESPM